MGIDAQMYLDVPYEVDREQVGRWAWNLAEAVGAEKFFIVLGDDEPHLAISKIDTYYQDGPEIKAEPGHTLLEVHLWGRYYGEGYERGNLWTYISVAEWIERNIQGAIIYYGGDSSGVCAEPFDKAAREALILHWATRGHRPYREGFDDGQREASEPKKCGLGPCKWVRNGWGQDYAAFFCAGCGQRKETRDGGKSWQDSKW